MLFNSLQFAIFMMIVFVLYWQLSHKYRWILLLISSYYFYMSWNPKYILLILCTTCVAYFCGLGVEYANTRRVKKIILLIALVICLGILFFFKYFDFCFNSIYNLLNFFAIQMNPITLNLLLPVGISFYTFQTLGYVIDVYRGDIKAERHFGIFATFISFFPQLVAGPIERTYNLLPQLKEEQRFDYNKAVYGLRLMLLGYFKKLIIADILAGYVDAIYEDLGLYKGFALVIVMVFFTIQIYCDFSGYSDIAIGTAKLLGINLMKNFQSPYYSNSVREFWHRWHISLSTWFRDYLYIPIGGKRCGRIRRYFNLLVTFLASGMWHGANWTFVIWGGVHGIAQIIEDVFSKLFYRMRENYFGKIISILVVFIFSNFAWIFFRAQTISDAVYFISNMWVGIENPISYLRTGFEVHSINIPILIYLIISIGVLALIDFLFTRYDVIAKIDEKNLVIRWLIYIFFVLWLIFFSQKGEAAEFVYFQF